MPVFDDEHKNLVALWGFSMRSEGSGGGSGFHFCCRLSPSPLHGCLPSGKARENGNQDKVVTPPKRRIGPVLTDAGMHNPRVLEKTRAHKDSELQPLLPGGTHAKASPPNV